MAVEGGEVRAVPRDILVRGVPDEVVEYLEEARKRGGWWTKTSWSEFIRGILREWVKADKAARLEESEAEAEVVDLGCEGV